MRKVKTTKVLYLHTNQKPLEDNRSVRSKSDICKKGHKNTPHRKVWGYIIHFRTV